MHWALFYKPPKALTSKTHYFTVDEEFLFAQPRRNTCTSRYLSLRARVPTQFINKIRYTRSARAHITQAVSAQSVRRLCKYMHARKRTRAEILGDAPTPSGPAADFDILCLSCVCDEQQRILLFDKNPSEPGMNAEFPIERELKGIERGFSAHEFKSNKNIVFHERASALASWKFTSWNGYSFRPTRPRAVFLRLDEFFICSTRILD